MPIKIYKKHKFNNQTHRGNVWHEEYDCCIKCGRIDRPYASNGLCTYCYAQSLYKDLPPLEEGIEIALGRKTKAVLPSETFTKLRYLRHILGNVDSSQVIRLAVDILYDTIGPLVGKIELTPEGFLDFMSNMRVQIIKSGIKVQASELKKILTETPEVERNVLSPNTKVIGGRMTGMLKK
jgi:hypothetical protein